MRTLLVVLLFGVWSCAPVWKVREFGQLEESSRITLCVRNNSISPYRIYVYGRGFGSVYPGETRKFEVTGENLTQSLVARELGGQDITTIEVNLSTAKNWQWELNNTQITGVVSLHPGNERCGEST